MILACRLHAICFHCLCFHCLTLPSLCCFSGPCFKNILSSALFLQVASKIVLIQIVLQNHVYIRNFQYLYQKYREKFVFTACKKNKTIKSDGEMSIQIQTSMAKIKKRTHLNHFMWLLHLYREIEIRRGQ